MPSFTHNPCRAMRPSRLPAVRLLLVIAMWVTSSPAQQPAGESVLLRRLGDHLDSLAARDEFSGVVTLARGGATVFARAYGQARREVGQANTVETAFNLGSINKHFTRVAVMQLAAEGKVALDSPLAVAWPSYPNPDVARRVTLRQLLEHRSGIGGNIFAAPVGGTRLDLRHNRDFIPLFAGRPLDFAPGTNQRYSNAGYVVLGGVVEAVSGEDYYAYVRRHIYEPAGMTRTCHLPVDSLPPWAAVGYTRSEGGLPGTGPLRPNTGLMPGRGSAAGGGYATAGDMLLFLKAVREGRVPGAQGAGIGIAGGAPGLNAAVEGDLPGGYDLVVMANLDPPAAEEVAATVRTWLGAAD